MTATFWRDMKRERWAYIFLALPLLHFAIFRLYPVVYSVYLSFVNFNIWGNTWVGLANFSQIFNDELFWKALWNTAYFTLLSVPLSLVIAFALSVLIFPLGDKSSTFFKAAYYLPSVASAAVLSLVWLWLFEPRFGLLNYLLSLVNVNRVYWLGDVHVAMNALILMTLAGGHGYSVILITAAMGGIPPSLYEAARLDGATRWQQFWRITLPLLKPITLYLLVIDTIGSFQIFTAIYIMTRGGPAQSTMTVVFMIYQTAFSFFNYGVASAQAMVLFVIILVVAALQYRFFGSDVEY
jgi:multiple sugar transport system permease protein